MANITRNYPQSQFTQTDTVVTGAGSGTANGTSATLAAANPNRVRLSITNLSATQTLYLGYGTTAVAGAGDALAPSGTLNVPGDSAIINDWLGSVTVVASASGASYGFVEL